MKKMVICGLGYISERVAMGCHHAANMELYGFLSSNEEKALAYQAKYQVSKIYLNYEDLFADKEVDVVYLATPNHVHFDQIMSCLKHGKHVICEKPMVASSTEIQTLFEYAKKQNCFLMEAEKTFFSPLLIELKKRIQEGVIGEVYHIQAEYNYDIRKLNYPDTHWVFQENGGCALDIGVYPICFSHFFANSQVVSSQNLKRSYQEFACDFMYQALIQYENGISSSVKSNWLQDFKVKGSGYIFGTKGYIEVPSYWKDNKAFIYTESGNEQVIVDMKSDFTGEIEHVACCLTNGLLQSPIVDEKMSLEILKVIE